MVNRGHHWTTKPQFRRVAAPLTRTPNLPYKNQAGGFESHSARSTNVLLRRAVGLRRAARVTPTRASRVPLARSLSVAVGLAPGGARLAASLRESGDGWAGRQEIEADV